MGSPGDKLRAQLAKGKKSAKSLKEGEKPAEEEEAKAKPKKAKKAAKKKAAPKKAAKKAAPKAAKKAPAKKAKAPAKKKAAPKAKKAAASKSNGVDRVNDRDRKGDGLRPVERKLLKLIEKHGPISLINLAQKHFRSKDIPREGPDSVRTIRNGIRKPVEYGIVEWTDRGVVDFTKYAKSKGVDKAVARYQKAAVNAAKESADDNGAAKPKKAKKAAKKPKKAAAKSKANGAPKKKAKKPAKKKAKKAARKRASA